MDGDGNKKNEAEQNASIILKNTQASSFTQHNFNPPFPPDGSETQGETITGTAGKDQIEGTFGADLIQGLGGNDTINGSAGSDEIDGGAGDDTIDGSYGPVSYTHLTLPTN